MRIIVAVGVLIVLGGGYFLWTTDRKLDSDAQERATTTELSSRIGGLDKTETDTTYTAADVASHNSAASCWAIIDGNVYDLTAWIGQHPGGPAAISQLCGKDGSVIFHNQHGNAQQQASLLAAMKIGALRR